MANLGEQPGNQGYLAENASELLVVGWYVDPEGHRILY